METLETMVKRIMNVQLLLIYLVSIIRMDSRIPNEIREQIGEVVDNICSIDENTDITPIKKQIEKLI